MEKRFTISQGTKPSLSLDHLYWKTVSLFWLPAYHHNCLEQAHWYFPHHTWKQIDWLCGMMSQCHQFKYVQKWMILFPIHFTEYTIFWFCTSIKYCQCITWFFIFRIMIYCLIWFFRSFSISLLAKLCFVAPHAILKALALKSNLVPSSTI